MLEKIGETEGFNEAAINTEHISSITFSGEDCSVWLSNRQKFHVPSTSPFRKVIDRLLKAQGSAAQVPAPKVPAAPPPPAK